MCRKGRSEQNWINDTCTKDHCLLVQRLLFSKLTKIWICMRLYCQFSSRNTYEEERGTELRSAGDIHIFQTKRTNFYSIYFILSAVHCTNLEIWLYAKIRKQDVWLNNLKRMMIMIKMNRGKRRIKFYIKLDYLLKLM